jgi:regulator of protease activity HflC (stomatin/prohibitin superfamily)
MNPKRLIIGGGLIAALLLLSSCALISCGRTVEPGSVGVKISRFGNAGVSQTPLPNGWHPIGFGESIETYPTITRTYSFTRAADDRGPENEEIVFTDRTGLPMTADVVLTMRVEPSRVPSLWTKYRLSFDQLLDGPIHNDIRMFIAEETERVGVEDLLAGGRQAVIQRAYMRLREKWQAEGVTITSLAWLGQIRFPQVIQQAIVNRTQADQARLAAEAQVAVAQANARQRVAEAQGIHDANVLIAQSMTPQVAQYRALERWDGHLPQATGGAIPFIQIPQQQ